MTDLVIEAPFAALLLGEACTGHLWHPVNRGDGTRIDRALERDTERVTNRDSSLLHCDRGQRWPNYVARCVDTRYGRAEVLVHDDPPPGIELYPQGLEAKALRIGDSGRRQTVKCPEKAAGPSRERHP